MKEYKFLNILDKFKGIYTKMGVDYESMRLILSMKLTLDSRRTSTVMQNSNSGGDKEDKNSFNKALIMYAIMGIFIGIITMFPFNIMYTYTIVFGMFMFFILTIFISDFSSVLLDVRDKNIIGTKGVDNKTINAAKLTHICYYIFLTSLALSWLAIIGSFKSGILIGVIFILELMVIDIFMVVITALLYLLILRFFDGEKVKDIINFVQIGLTIIMTISYQFLGRMFDIVDINIVYKSNIWNLILPPMWFASPLHAINGGQINEIIIILIVLALIVPVIAISLYIKNTSKFEDSLSKLNIVKDSEKEKKHRLFYRIGKWTCRNNEEKAVYDLSSSIIKREREFKLMTYPSLGFNIVFPLLFIFMYSMDSISEIKNISLHMSLNIYWFIFMVPTLLMTLQYSNDYKAAWIYETAYISDKSNVYKGAYKALLANILLPLYLFESIIFIVIFGIKVLPILITAFVFLLVFIVIEHMLGKNTLPFTLKFGDVNKSQNLINTLLGMVILCVGVGINYLALSNVYALVAYSTILMFVAFILWSKCIKA
ncbi:MAG: ABC transporter permease [Terrisporobacter othiniensis]|uniref:ABC transporter permease n=2 Tax=Terrisporobacter hibernicus TaxID=2813371 RepID=A0AAX2ZJ25_9FIRM|nr:MULTISPECIES: ABC transporter permease [Terrisporobacter]MBN9648227.1 ABC transporter permease [Terrisporobacter glycolicus]MDU4861828.1 ABC transporter permease [Terrisporobacter othiniensis]MDU6995088.1 ABC transporter permease [Terrisporobacter othiniensis]UEL49036.1 ABC transporter permease [Terrisporobacter hibernicus]